MLRDFSSSQETKPLLEDTRKTIEPTSSSSKKFTYFVLFLFVISSIIVLGILNQSNNVAKNKKFVFTDEWSVLESIETKYLPKQWAFDSLCDDDETIQITFAIKQQNTDLIHDKIYEVSNPSSSKFGNHWSMEEIHDFLKPQDSSINMILSWFDYYDITTDNIEYLTLNKDFIRIQTTVKVANEMLNTQYAYWSNADGDKHIRVKDSYHVPTTISDHLDFISPSLRFPPQRHTNSIKKIDETLISSEVSTVYNTPERLRSLYYMNDYIGKANYPGHFQSVASFLGEWFTNNDIETFWEFFSIDSVDLVRVPSFQPIGDGDEAELDIEYITSTGSGIDTYVWDVEDDLYFVTLLKQMMDSDSPPSVVSMSYGGDEQSNGYAYCNRANLEFAKIGLYGVTALASSGDSGVTGDSEQCTDEYYPSFPASSPYVIAVGGVTGGDIQTSVELSTGETAWIDSGGGFSWFFERQAWQNEAAENYFKLASRLPDSTKYNENGRGYPDISLQSVDYVICVSSEYWSVSGTSCSCPSVAGMFALINDLRLQSGKSTLGWALPSLYNVVKNGTNYFNDVTDGYNLGCSEDDDVGFSASKMWDPVTGFGTPKFPKLLNALLNL